MSYKLVEGELTETKKKRFTLPKVGGRIGVALFFAGKEVFVGCAITDIVEEQIIKRKYIKPQKASVQVLRFD
jgi:hypothetical protein